MRLRLALLLVAVAGPAWADPAEDRVRTAYACGVHRSPKEWKWFANWEAYRRWNVEPDSDPLYRIQEDELEAIGRPELNKVPPEGCDKFLDNHLAAGQIAYREYRAKKKY